MKNYKKIILITIIYSLSGTLIAQKKNRFSKQISLSFNAILHDSLTKNYSILIFSEGVKKDSMFKQDTKSVKFNFDYGKTYSLMFSKDGFRK